MIKRKYKFVNDVKISKFNVTNASTALKNEKIERNAMTKNRKFEQIEQVEQTTIVQQNIKKKHFSTMLIAILQTKETFFAFVDLFTRLIFKSISHFILHVQLSTSILSKIFFIFINDYFTFDFLTFLLNLH